MEPIKGKIKYIIETKVIGVREEFMRVYISGYGPSTVFQNVSKGWYIYLQGSYEALCVGHEKPDLKEGDPIIISIEKNNAILSKPSE